MKQYEYVRVQGTGVMSARFEDHRSVIDRYAAQGYSYAGYIPAAISAHGVVTEMDLIFEKELE